MTPERLLHYRIHERLGSGGMGDVYLAEDMKLDRRVALKVLKCCGADDPERRQRFEQEAKALAALNHPNIVTIYAVEQAGDVTFLAMELVLGRTLSELIPDGGMPFDRLLEIAICLADALTAAHERGVIHRDLKPANVMVTGDGRVKVLDFGLAKFIEVRESANSATTALQFKPLTGEGRIVGTVCYMSPEQAVGLPLDHRTDIFSLGVVLYELATGERPFGNLLSLIGPEVPPSIADIKPSLPPELRRIIRRALIKDRDHRYQTVRELRRDLETLKAERLGCGSGRRCAWALASWDACPPSRSSAQATVLRVLVGDEAGDALAAGSDCQRGRDLHKPRTRRCVVGLPSQDDCSNGVPPRPIGLWHCGRPR
jgi:eukaryotic-like serine/threonine-protein kinase